MKPDALFKSAIRESHLSAEYILYLDCKCPSMAMLMKPGNLFRKYDFYRANTAIKISNNNHWTNKKFYFKQKN